MYLILWTEEAGRLQSMTEWAHRHTYKAFPELQMQNND